MRKVKVYIVDAFTNEQFKGNPAGVVLDANHLTDDEMQKIAKELNLSETVFLLDDDKVRYFTRTQEIDFCGHATLGLSWILGSLSTMKRLELETNIGIIPIQLKYKDGQLEEVVMRQVEPKIKEYTGTIEELCQVMGLNKTDIEDNYPIKFAYTGNWDLLLPIKSKELIDLINPNMKELSTFQEKYNITSVHLFTFDTKDKEIDLYTRNFAPFVGINEDPVTGSTTGALVGYLLLEDIVPMKKQRFKVKQTNSLKREGLLKVEVGINKNKPQISVGGTAVCSLEGSIVLEERK